MVQWLRHCASNAAVGFDPWSGELRSHMPHGSSRKKPRSKNTTTHCLGHISEQLNQTPSEVDLDICIKFLPKKFPQESQRAPRFKIQSWSLVPKACPWTGNISIVWELLEMQILGPQPQTMTERKCGNGALATSVPTELPRWFRCTGGIWEHSVSP